MSATAKALVYFELKCDECGDVYEDDEGTLYSEASEVRQIAHDGPEWCQQPDGRDLCPECAWADEAVAAREAADR